MELSVANPAHLKAACSHPTVVEHEDGNQLSPNLSLCRHSLAASSAAIASRLLLRHTLSASAAYTACVPVFHIFDDYASTPLHRSYSLAIVANLCHIAGNEHPTPIVSKTDDKTGQ